MGGINVKRWLAGSLAAGALVWVVEGAASVFYMDDMMAAMAAHDLSMEMSVGTWAITVLVSLISGGTLVFFYAAARPRFGPGPRTAILVGAVVWLGGYFLSVLGYLMIGLYPTSMLVLWGGIGLVELIAASLLGAWIYREEAVAAEPAPAL